MSDADHIPSIIIVGDGLTAGEVMQRLTRAMEGIVEQTNTELPAKIEVIGAGPREKFWRGLPWDKDNIIPRLHLTDTYVVEDDAERQTEHGECSRANFTDKILKLYEDTMALYKDGHHGIQMTTTPNTRVVDIRKDGDQYVVVDDKGIEKKADFVVLATGHFTSKSRVENKGFLNSPWPARAMQDAITPGQHVAVIGTGLSAVDAINTAADKLLGGIENADKCTPEQGNITAFSPHGMLSGVVGFRDRMEIFTLGNFLRKPQLTLQETYEAWRNEFITQLDHMEQVDATHQAIKEALLASPTVDDAVQKFCDYYEKTGPKKWLENGVNAAKPSAKDQKPILWQNLMTVSAQLLEIAYQHFSAEDKEHFAEKVRPIYKRLSNGMVISNAEHLLKLMERDFLHIKKLGPESSISPGTDRDGGEVRYMKDGQQHDEYFPVIIKAVGEDMSRIESSSPLMKKLFASGMVHESITPYEDQDKARERFDAQMPGTTQRIRKIGDTYYYAEGGIDIDRRTCEVCSTDYKNPSTNMFAAGVPLYQDNHLLMGVDPIMNHAMNIARCVAKRAYYRNLEPKHIEAMNAMEGVITSDDLMDDYRVPDDIINAVNVEFGGAIVLTNKPLRDVARHIIADTIGVPDENVIPITEIHPAIARRANELFSQMERPQRI